MLCDSLLLFMYYTCYDFRSNKNYCQNYIGNIMIKNELLKCYFKQLSLAFSGFLLYLGIVISE